MRSVTLTSAQRTTGSKSQIVWSAIALLGLLTALALWLVWSLSSLQASEVALPDNAQSQPQALVPLDGIVQVVAGGNHTCALTTAGGVKCWGRNDFGQLGDGSTSDKNTPVDVVGLGSGVAAIAAGYAHTCALTIAGGVKCWGNNGYGQLGDNTTIDKFTPVDVVGLGSGVTAIATGGGFSGSHSCALSTAGGVKCWGHNLAGELGDGTIVDKSSPVSVVNLDSSVTAIAAGYLYTCALSTAGGVKCWGVNGSGQLGIGTTGGPETTPVGVVGLGSGVAAIAVGKGDWESAHTCALSTAGGVKCWGYNSSGQLGDGTTTLKSSPVDVIGLGSGITAITAGYSHTCALSTTGGSKCWGNNRGGQLGDGTTANKITPVDVNGLDDVTIIIAGGFHTCALTMTSGVKCWGSNRYGQLGDGTGGNKSTPTDVAGLGSGVAAIAGGGAHTCALSMMGGVQCWGANWAGQLGDGTRANKNTPVDVVGLGSGVAAIVGGNSHTCALSTAGGVKCWGINTSGQVGNDTAGYFVATPVGVVGLSSDIAAISASDSHTCALSTVGGGKCWGRNDYGQLGDGTLVDKSTPVDVVGLDSGVSAIAAGGSHTCVLIIGGGVKCWGRNDYGQLGDSTLVDKSTPVDVMGLGSGAIAIAAGRSHTCALTTAGGTKCWGRNDNGQLGDGMLVDKSTPVDVVGMGSGMTAIVAGGGNNGSHTCTLTVTGGVKCWGWNHFGQVGDGTTTDTNTPVDVVGLGSGAVAITSGDAHTCALTTTGGAKCWGRNSSDELGDGTAWRTTPVDVVVQINQLFLPAVQR